MKQVKFFSWFENFCKDKKCGEFDAKI